MDDGHSDEFIDVLDVFDGKGEADNDSDSGEVTKHEDSRKQRTLPDDEDNASQVEDEGNDDQSPSEGDSDDGDAGEDAIVVSASEDEEDPAPEALASLENFISTLEPSKKRKAPADGDSPLDSSATRLPKRRMIKERTEAGLENEFGARASGESVHCT